MKQWILTLSILLGTSLAMAGGARTPQSSFKSDDFNQMIQENQKAEAQLRTHLQEKAGIRLDDKPGTVAREKIEAPREPEQVVVNTNESIWNEPTSKKDRSARARDKADMKRISQELREASH